MDEDANSASDADNESDYTDREIDYLIRCKKRVIQPPRKKMSDVQGSLRNEMTVESVEERYHFHIFMRQNIDFNENFSIGLVFLPSDGRQKIRLIRFNGVHVHRELASDSMSSHWHECYHIHKAKAGNISAGSREDQSAVRTDRYASYEEALSEFFREIHLIDIRDHFPTPSQSSLDFGKEEH
ncbi:MAG TPA: hypothetical protein VM163_02075 [bacterium]|nr:hypothetical protein [bacterium]